MQQIVAWLRRGRTVSAALSIVYAVNELFLSPSLSKVGRRGDISITGWKMVQADASTPCTSVVHAFQQIVFDPAFRTAASHVLSVNERMIAFLEQKNYVVLHRETQSRNHLDSSGNIVPNVGI
jgi:hypothetical protein